MDRHSEVLQMENGCLQSQGQVKRRIDVLPDEILLDIFDFRVRTSSYWDKRGTEEWQLLVHVCRRWRSLVFASPRRLNLQLYCSHKTRARGTLDVWPALPLIVKGNMYALPDMDNIVTTLGRSNQVFQVALWNLEGRQLEQVVVAMQAPFPELTSLSLKLVPGDDSETAPEAPVIPDSFLGGSAPRLLTFESGRIPFPGLPKLFSSATNLVRLWLYDIPHSGYISPEAVVALLSVLSSLKSLVLEFLYPRSRLDRTRRAALPKRSVIPALTFLRFQGFVKYLEDLVPFIDAPQLVKMKIAFLHQIDFDIPRLAQFIDRTPKLTKHDAQLKLYIHDYSASVELPSAFGTVEIKVFCIEPNGQLSFLEQICNSPLHCLSTVEDLYIEHRYLVLDWEDDAIDNTLWLQLLLPFTAVKNLYLAWVIAPYIATTLQELVGGRIIEVLPKLQNIFVESLRFASSGRFQKQIGKFVAARQLSDHPIVISDWDKLYDDRWLYGQKSR